MISNEVIFAGNEHAEQEVLCYYKAMIAYEVIVNWVVPKIIHMSPTDGIFP